MSSGRAGAGRVPSAAVRVHEARDGLLVERGDRLALEEPLEIRVTAAGRTRTLSVTMRTPGHDFELVAGFLLGEGVVDSAGTIRRISYCTRGAPDARVEPDQRYNVVSAELLGPAPAASLERHVITSSACGVCGTTSIDAVRLAGTPVLGAGPLVTLETLSGLPGKLRQSQRGFEATGGLHGAGLFSGEGELLGIREDVGRHNAVDKVLGRALLDGELPLSDRVLMVSGRISFEIVQKAARAGVPVVAAVSAATSLAARLAGELGMTLVGFVRGERCTVYAGRERLLELGERGKQRPDLLV